jgi:hypothetical protein
MYMAKSGKPAARQAKPAARSKSDVSAKPRARAKPAETARTDSDVGASHDDIAVAAYFRAQDRGFTPGAEMDDWLHAEQEIRATGAGEGG